MSSEMLALKWRPTRFDQMVGQRFVSGSLSKMVEKETVPNALLFSGPPGTGKTTTARILAAELDATDVIEVDAAANGGIDEVRTILASLRYATGGKHRVVILDEAHSITEKGFDTLLKTLEEPPELTIFVLVTTERHRIPKRIKSRLMEFSFRAVTAGDVAQRLAHIATTEKIPIERALVIHLANRANGDLRGAIQDLDLAARAGIQTLAAYVDSIGDGDPAPTLFAALMEGNHAKIFSIVEDQLQRIGDPAHISAELCHLITDLFSIKAGGKMPEGQRYEVRKQIASRVDHERLLLVVRMLWDLRTKIRSHADPRASLDLALILVSEVLSRANPARFVPPTVDSPQTPTVPAAAKKMSLAEMQRE